jgi:glycogenin glucosyltransferase
VLLALGVLSLSLIAFMVSVQPRSEPPSPPRRRYAIATYLTNDAYLEGAAVLMSSAARHTKDVDFIVFGHKPFSPQARKRLGERVQFRYADLIMPSKPSSFERFRDQYTKLGLWNFTEYDLILYLDADTLIVADLDLKPLDDLAQNWLLSYFFAACIDISGGKWTTGINAGVMFLRPDTNEYRRLLDGIEPAIAKNAFDTTMSEQAYLSYIYFQRMLVLPTTWNMNLAIYSQKRAVWDEMADYISIIHFTMEKPFESMGTWKSSEYREVLQLWHNELVLSKKG